VGEDFLRLAFKDDQEVISEPERNHDLSFKVGVLKSAFVKGGLREFSISCQISPDLTSITSSPLEGRG
jgi:hypothetical protein